MNALLEKGSSNLVGSQVTYSFLITRLTIIDFEKISELTQTLMALDEENLSLSSRIDTTCVLPKGVICNLYPNGEIDGLPGPN